MKKKQKNKLPPYVFTKDDKWYVRRGFPTKERDDKGRIIYTQIVRLCEPQTIERAAGLSSQIEHEARICEPVRSSPDARTVKSLVSDFVDAKHGSVEPRTLQYYRWMFEQYLDRPGLGRMEIGHVTPLTIQNFYGQLAKSGTSPTMIRKLQIFLSMAFKQGIRWELLQRNPCEGVMLPRQVLPEIDVMNKEQARAFMAVCLADPDLLVLAFALDTWMRPGEYLALEPRSVDLNNRTVRVERSVTFPKGGGHSFKSPKTKSSRRIIEISEPMCDALVSSIGKGGLVFPARNGSPIRYQNLGQRQMADACTRAGLRKFSIYSLRHTGATIALAAGAHIKNVSERLGHKSIQTTLDIYTHVLPAMKSETVSILTKALY